MLKSIWDTPPFAPPRKDSRESRADQPERGRFWNCRGSDHLEVGRFVQVGPVRTWWESAIVVWSVREEYRRNIADHWGSSHNPATASRARRRTRHDVINARQQR